MAEQFKTVNDIPADVRGRIPPEAQEIWRKAANESFAAGKGESEWTAHGYDALSKNGWEEQNGRWEKFAEDQQRTEISPIKPKQGMQTSGDVGTGARTVDEARMTEGTERARAVTHQEPDDIHRFGHNQTRDDLRGHPLKHPQSPASDSDGSYPGNADAMAKNLREENVGNQMPQSSRDSTIKDK